jgi:hypothetical protein
MWLKSGWQMNLDRIWITSGSMSIYSIAGDFPHNSTNLVLVNVARKNVKCLAAGLNLKARSLEAATDRNILLVFADDHLVIS